MAQWHVTGPRTGVSDPLVIDFAKPLDYAPLGPMLTVLAAAGPLAGAIAVEHDEI